MGTNGTEDNGALRTGERLRVLAQADVLYVTTSLPSLTLTFVYREIAALREKGVGVEIVSMNRPRAESVSAEAEHLLETTLFLDQVPLLEKITGCVSATLRNPGRAARSFWRLLCAQPRRFPRDYLRLVYHWMEALYLGGKLSGSKIRHIHSHVESGATTIAMFLASYMRLPFSFTMHGPQIYLDPIGLQEKLRSCEFVVSISEYHMRHVLKVYGADLASKFHIVRCGLDMARFPVAAPRRNASRFFILGVGRLVEMKGFEYLIRACGVLREAGLDFECHIVGGGPEADRLKRLVHELGLGSFVLLDGPRKQEELLSYFSRADVFALPCVIGGDKAQDGLPVVLMEAMAWQIPVVSSRLVGIPELVSSGEHGILVEPGDWRGVAAALMALQADPALRSRYGQQGRERVEKAFNVRVSAAQLSTLFQSTPSAH